MKVYVASHCRWAGLYVAGVLETFGIEITSGWLHLPFNPTGSYTDAEKRDIAEMDFNDVRDAAAVVLVAGPDKYSGGKFVEAGIAMGLGRRVVVIGRRENMLLWHHRVEVVADAHEAAKKLLGVE